MSDAAIRRQQSAAARKQAEARQRATAPDNPAWRATQEQNIAQANQRLADTPERRAKAKEEYLGQVRRQERWDAEDAADDAEFAGLREKRRELRRKEREGQKR